MSTDRAPVTEIPRPGQVIRDGLTIARPLKAGGMAQVFAAHDRRLEREVAVKFLARDVAATGPRLAREARAAMALHNGHVVRVYGMGDWNDVPYLVMELLDGEDLGTLVKRAGPLPATTAIDYVLQACCGIAEAHARGIVHRDLKPSNLFLTRGASGEPFIKVLDFGISKLDEGTDNPELTSSDVTLGSPSYMSPEQWRSSKSVDARADVWSLGVMLHMLTTGVAPFVGTSATELCVAITVDPPTLRLRERPDVPPDLENAVRQCLTKDRRKRPNLADLVTMLAPLASTAGRRDAELALSLCPATSASGFTADEVAAEMKQEGVTQFAGTTTITRAESERGYALPDPRRPARRSFFVAAMIGLPLVAGLSYAVVGRTARPSIPSAAAAPVEAHEPNVVPVVAPAAVSESRPPTVMPVPPASTGAIVANESRTSVAARPAAPRRPAKAPPPPAPTVRRDRNNVPILE